MWPLPETAMGKVYFETASWMYFHMLHTWYTTWDTIFSRVRSQGSPPHAIGLTRPPVVLTASRYCCSPYARNSVPGSFHHQRLLPHFSVCSLYTRKLLVFLRGTTYFDDTVLLGLTYIYTRVWYTVPGRYIYIYIYIPGYIYTENSCTMCRSPFFYSG